MHTFRACLLLCTAWLLCGFGFDAVQFDPAQRQRIVSIGVAPFTVPEAVVQVNSVTRNPSALGFLILMAAGQPDAREILVPAGYDYRRGITDGIVSTLNSAGFIAAQLPGARGQINRQGFLKAVPTDAGVDAILDVSVISVGYFATNPSSDYRAGCHLIARLVDPKTNQVLFQKQIIHGSVAPASGRAVILRTPVPERFENSDALRVDVRRTSAALKMSIDAVVAELGRQLGEPPPPRHLPGSVDQAPPPSSRQPGPSITDTRPVASSRSAARAANE